MPAFREIVVGSGLPNVEFYRGAASLPRSNKEDRMMTRSCTFVLVTLVLTGANLAQAQQDWRASPEPVRPFKLLPVSTSEVVEVKDALPPPVTSPADAKSAPQLAPSAEAKSVPQQPDATPCHTEVVSGWKSAVPRCGCIRRTWQWLTYRPLPNPCAYQCHIAPNPWGIPSPYVFFPCNRDGSGACNRSAPSNVACGSAVPIATGNAPLDH
jgi:hypothetical protein